jgi:hypothetical protein
MKRYFVLILSLILFVPSGSTQLLPEGYILQYQQSFSGSISLSDFWVANPEAWGIFNAGGNFYLHFKGFPHQGPPSRLPENITVLNNHIFGDFILEAQVMPEIDSNGYGEICLFVGLKDLSNYYCIQLANRCDSLYHGIYVVKKSVIRRLTGADAAPVAWESGKWQRIRVERNIVKRTILVYVGDARQPVLQCKDYELVMGSVGFGSFSGSGRIDNIKIWAPTVIRDEGQGTGDK